MGSFKFILFAIPVLLSAVLLGCASSPSQSPSTLVPTPTTPTPNPTPTTWKMEVRWNVDTVGIPFMDLRSDGGLAAALDWNGGVIHLVKPSGDDVAYHIQENDAVKPVVAGVAVKGDAVYVAANYEHFSGARIYTWNGMSGEMKVGGSVAETIARSPSGDHLCLLLSDTLHCDGWKVKLKDYGMLSVSDDGFVVVGGKNPVLVVKDGKILNSFNANEQMAVTFKDRIIAQIDGSLLAMTPDGKTLASNSEFGFHIDPLLKIHPIPSGKYIFAFRDGDTHVLTWNLSEVRILPGKPEFANKNFVVTSVNKVLHCYSLGDFHEVWTVKLPVDIGYVMLSDDGRVLLVSGDTGGFWLYTASS